MNACEKFSETPKFALTARAKATTEETTFLGKDNRQLF